MGLKVLKNVSIIQVELVFSSLRLKMLLAEEDLEKSTLFKKIIKNTH